MSTVTITEDPLSLEDLLAIASGTQVELSGWRSSGDRG
jgi:hypothetical protein